LPASPSILIGSTAFLAAAIGGTLTYAALSPGSQLFGPTLIAGNDPSEAALTYDDGPNPNATPELLDILARHGARATFFFLGSFVRQQPELVRRVHAAGHLIGNHTQTHPWLYRQPERIIREELYACNAALEDALGVTVRYFRPPYGSRRTAVLRIARELGLTTVQWNCMGHDWEPIGVDGILARIDRGLVLAQRRRTGANILLHDGHNVGLGADRADTLRVTDILIGRFQRDGVSCVTVDAWG
jgi:peptidoglycan/xylan/chitin deacetylase (PgdA/CDA1 family)